jgi:hypothetical protein
MTAQVGRRTGWWPRSARDGDLHYGTLTDELTVTCERCGAVFTPQPPPLVGALLAAQVQPSDPEHPCRPTR